MRLRLTLLVIVVMTALVAGVAGIALPRAASASPAVPMIDPIAASLTPTQKSLVLAEAAAAQARAQAATARARALAARKAQLAKVQQVRMRIVQVARKQLGDRYSAGSSGPSAFDCSGLTRYVYRVVTGKELPHNSHAQYSRVKRIGRAQARPGDLVFFFRGGAHHVGIYIGNGRMIDARGYGEGVKVSPISGSWWGRSYSGMGRILPA